MGSRGVLGHMNRVPMHVQHANLDWIKAFKPASTPARSSPSSVNVPLTSRSRTSSCRLRQPGLSTVKMLAIFAVRAVLAANRARGGPAYSSPSLTRPTCSQVDQTCIAWRVGADLVLLSNGYLRTSSSSG